MASRTSRCKLFKIWKQTIRYNYTRENDFSSTRDVISFDGGISNFNLSSIWVQAVQSSSCIGCCPVPSGGQPLGRDRRAHVGTLSFELIYIYTSGRNLCVSHAFLISFFFSKLHE